MPFSSLSVCWARRIHIDNSINVKPCDGKASSGRELIASINAFLIVKPPRVLGIVYYVSRQSLPVVGLYGGQNGNIIFRQP